METIYTPGWKEALREFIVVPGNSRSHAPLAEQLTELADKTIKETTETMELRGNKNE